MKKKLDEKLIAVLSAKNLSLSQKINNLETIDADFHNKKIFQNFSSALESLPTKKHKLLPIIGYIHYQKKDFEQAIDFLENSLKLHQQIISDKIRTDILEKLSNIYEIKKEKENSVRILQEGLKLTATNDDKKGELFFSSCLGTHYLQIRDFKRAMHYHKRSLEISIELKDRKKESVCLNHIGVVYYTIENYEKALEYILRSFELRKKGENKHYLGNSLNNIGVIYQHLEKFEKSVEVIEKALKIHESINNKEGISTSLNNLGTAYDRLEKFEKALQCHLKNLALRQEIDDKSRILSSMSNIGNVYKNSGDFAKALEYYQRSLNDFTDYLTDADKVILYTNLGSVYMELQNYQKAEKFFLAGEKIAEKIDSKESLKSIYNYLSDHFERLQEHKQSLKYFKKYTQLKDEFHQKHTSKKILELQLNFEIEQQEKEHEINKLKKFSNKYSLINKDLEQRIEKEFLGESKAIRSIIKETLNVAKYKDTNVIITGESGTGKEIIARIIHHASVRKSYGFYPINCTAIPDTLLESEFFGHKKGSFTNAINDKKGFFELAHKGTLFLDEIADMPLNLQAKLLRVLEEKKLKKLGDEKEIFIDVRIIAASNRDIEKLVEKEKFRLDLYHRINTLIINIPPLRQRPEDIQPLLNYFIEKFKHKFNIPELKIDNNLLDHLHHYNFPGNVRELKNLVERALIICDNNILDSSCFPILTAKEQAQEFTDLNIKKNEEQLIRSALEKTGNNQTKAAKILGISRHTLMRRIAEMRKSRT